MCLRFRYFLRKVENKQSEGEWIQNNNGIYKGIDYVMQEKFSFSCKILKQNFLGRWHPSSPLCTLRANHLSKNEFIISYSLGTATAEPGYRKTYNPERHHEQS